MDHYESSSLKFKAEKLLTAVGMMKYINHWQMQGRPDLCFIWIPKTAGSSVFRWLNETVQMRKYLRPDYVKGAFPNMGASTFGHMDYLRLVSDGYVGKDYHANSFKFSFVRNPFDRAVSLFYFLKRINMIDQNIVFKEFLELVSKGVSSIGLHNVKQLSQCNPQVDWITDGVGNVFVDYLGDMEHYRESLYELADNLRILPHEYRENETARNQIMSDLYEDNECTSLVRDIYKRDFEILGYSTDPHVRCRTK